MSVRKPLRPSEVPEEWRDYILWDTQGQRSKDRTYVIGITCPLCNIVHWTKESAVRNRYVATMRCNSCASRQLLEPSEVPEEWRPYIAWDEARKRHSDGRFGVWVACPACEDKRLVPESDLRGGERKSLECRRCMHSKKGTEKKGGWRGGRHTRRDGYTVCHINGLSEWDYSLAKQMIRDGGVYVAEHRLVMARHLGRPLVKGEIVHHKDGKRANNKLENLELLTKKQHCHAHGNPYYQKWQEALSHIKVLEAEIEILKG